MSKSRIGAASRGTSVPFSFSAVNVAAMSATPDRAGKKTLCAASAASVRSPADPAGTRRLEKMKSIGMITKTNIRRSEARSRKTSQRISRQAISHHFMRARP